MTYCLCLVVLLGWPATGGLIVLAGVLMWRYRSRGSPTDLGSARWADAKDLADAGMLGSSRGMILGRLPRTTRRLLLFVSRSAAPLVRNSNAVHTAVFGPTGSGKGVSFVIPTLLTNPESCVVLDYKGELARATAKHRVKYFGHRVVLLDPYRSVTNTPDALMLFFAVMLTRAIIAQSESPQPSPANKEVETRFIHPTGGNDGSKQGQPNPGH